MNRCFPDLFAVLVVATALATGCRFAGSGNNGHTFLVRKPATAQAALERQMAAHAHYAAAVIHELNEETEPALQEYILAARNDPADEVLLVEVSQRLLQARQFKQAIELLAPATLRREASGRLFLRLAVAYSQLGDIQKAIEANRAALQRTPGLLPAYQNLFLNYLQTKQPEAALKTLDEAAAQPETDPEFLIRLAELYTTCGAQFPNLREVTRPRALAMLNRAASARELAPALRLKLADGLNLFGDNERAAAAYLDLVNQPNLSPAMRELLRTKLADLYLRTRDPQRATTQLEAIVRDNPANPAAYYFLGHIALEQKNWTNAVDNFQKMILFNPDLEQAYYDLASAQIALDRGDDAVATLEGAQKKFPIGFVSEYLLGVAHHTRKQYAVAVNHFTSAEHLAQAGETNRLNPGFYFQLGAAFERKGDRAEAEKYFEKCLALAPDDAEALNYLGYMWAEKGEKLERARSMIERAVKSDPTNAAFLDSLGWVLFQLGQPREAVEYLLQAIARDDKPDATVFDHLGDAYAALNEMTKAREAWTKSLAIEASAAVRKKLEAATAR
jgi:tetratricopeptide (TPR) repeat protein